MKKSRLLWMLRYRDIDTLNNYVLVLRNSVNIEDTFFQVKNKFYMWKINLLADHNWKARNYYYRWYARDFTDFIKHSRTWRKLISKPLRVRKISRSLTAFFVKNFFKNGLQLRFIKHLNRALKHFYFYFYFFNKQEYNFISTVFYLDIIDEEYMFCFFGLEYVLKPIFEMLEQLFVLKLKKIDKKYRKKFKTRYNISVVRMQKKKRISYTCKRIVYAISSAADTRVEDRVYKILLDLVLNYKASKLFKRKIKTYVLYLAQLNKNTYK